ncbi:hypothetical protein [Ruminococcus sp.]|uniref:hypothetical protein n=1 Tax=Ruminococcus sp. TaxID=41978 RepID=UPI0025FB1576|nr:hypothetical protein [Ruminococcus sp.]MBQ8967774.1 hypothetical protein [Ruminococcus sp.]
MDKIRYNEEQEAFEIDYQLWGKSVTVLFYMEDQQEIIGNISEIADLLGRLDRNKKRIAEIIKRDGRYDKKKFPLLTSAEIEEQMKIESAFVDMDEDGIVLGATAVTDNGALGEGVMVELLSDGSLEISSAGKLM